MLLMFSVGDCGWCMPFYVVSLISYVKSFTFDRI